MGRHAPVSAPPDDPSHALFVLHAASDTGFVRGYLLPALNLPPEQVLTVDDLPLGSVTVVEIDRAVSRSRITLLVLSPAWIADRGACFGEQLASHRSIRDGRLIPLQLIDCELPLRLDARVALDFRDRSTWASQVDRLRQRLETSPPPAVQIACPYPGMRSFAESDASRFFGRGPEIEDLIARLDRGEREIYVIGPSGSGKSSLVQAGLLPILSSGSSRLGRSLVACTMRPGERPADRLARLLDGGAASIAEILVRHPPAERVLVVIDQVEELFTLASVVERQRFVAAIRALRTEPACALLLALRADFYGAFMDSALWPEPGMSRLDIAPLRGAGLAQAIRGPASDAGVHLEASLCDRLVADASDEPGVLPLMQETLRLLWDRRRERFLGLDAYEALGNGGRALDVAIAQRAMTAMRGLSEHEQAIARRVLLRLVSFGEGRPDTRRQQEVRELRSSADHDEEFSRVLRQLVEHRLITLGEAEPDHGALADLSHEALITGWPDLTEWIAQRRADEQRRRRLEAKVSEWVERGRGSASLLDRVELEEALLWLQGDAAREVGYGSELLVLIAASRAEIEHSDRQRRRRAILAMIVLVAFLVTASGLALVAWLQRKDAQAQGALAQRRLGMRYLEAGRALLVADHPMQALPLLVEARAQGVAGPRLEMLFAQAAAHLPRVALLGHSGFVTGAVFSRDGARVATRSGAQARVWDAGTGAPVTPPLVHRGPVSAVAFSPDGKRVATASYDLTARVWDAATGVAVTPPLAHQGLVTAIAFSPDGASVVTASDDATARVWDAGTGELRTTLAHDGAVTTARFSPDGTHVVTASEDHTARVWTAAAGGGPIVRVVHEAVVTAVAFSDDGRRIVTASEDWTARVWDAASGEPITPPLVHDAPVIAAEFSPDGARVVTASGDRGRVWSAATGEPVTPPLVHEAAVTAARFSPDGTHVVTASADDTARIWSVATGRPLASLEHQGAITDAAFSPDGTRVVTASEDRSARLWDATGRANLAPARSLLGANLAGFSPDGSRLVTAGRAGARLWNATTAAALTPVLDDVGPVSAAGFSPDGTRIAIAGASHVRIVDATGGGAPTASITEQSLVLAVVFSPDGTRVALASGDHASLWDVESGKPVTPPLLHDKLVTAVGFSPDGSRVVTASWDRTARIWSAETGRPVTAPLGHDAGVIAASFSPDGRRLVTVSEGHAQLWDANGQPLARLDHRAAITAVSFSPDGSLLATASGDHTARVWSATTGDPVTMALEHDQRVVSVGFNHDATLLVTASDTVARVWDAATGKLVIAALAHPQAVIAAAFSPDGSRVITTSRDQLARIWDLPADDASLDDWQLRARCGPIALVHDVLTAQPRPIPACPREPRSDDGRVPPRSQPHPASPSIPRREQPGS